MSDLREHYRKLLAEHGDAAESAQHADESSQRNRFRVLAEIAEPLGSVVDLGCGLGHFYPFLKERGFKGRYLGLDFLPEFVERAAARHAGDPDASFKTFDLRRDAYPEGWDYYVICGVFNNAMDDNAAFLHETLEKAFAAAKLGVAFNALSTYVDYQAEGLYYADPVLLLEWCKRRLTRNLVLRHDYLVREDRPAYEYAVYLYK